MSEVGGFVASVGDELSCELDIREHAELYAAVGGFDVNEITHGLGVGRSPSATWFQLGETLSREAQVLRIRPSISRQYRGCCSTPVPLTWLTSSLLSQ